jgi:hypothetical protein
MQSHEIPHAATLHRTEIRIAILNETHGAVKRSGRRRDNDVLANAAGSFPSESTTDIWDHDTNFGKLHLQRPCYLPLSCNGHLC